MTSYPNPVTDQLVVVLNDVKEGQTNHFTITSLSGMVVLEQSVKSDSGYMSQVFDLSAFNNGMYLLRWTNGQQAITKKIIVSK